MNIHDEVAARLLRAKNEPQLERSAKLYSKQLRDALVSMSEDGRLIFLEPGLNFDQCVVGACSHGGHLRVVYDLNAVVGVIAMHFDIPLEQAYTAFEQLKEQMETQPHGALFFTNVADIIAGVELMKRQREG